MLITRDHGLQVPRSSWRAPGNYPNNCGTPAPPSGHVLPHHPSLLGCGAFGLNFALFGSGVSAFLLSNQMHGVGDLAADCRQPMEEDLFAHYSQLFFLFHLSDSAIWDVLHSCRIAARLLGLALTPIHQQNNTVIAQQLSDSGILAYWHGDTTYYCPINLSG